MQSLKVAPVAANGVLYVNNGTTLYAIAPRYEWVRNEEPADRGSCRSAGAFPPCPILFTGVPSEHRKPHRMVKNPSCALALALAALAVEDKTAGIKGR